MNLKPITFKLSRMFWKLQWPLQRSDWRWSRLACYKRSVTLRNRPILMNLSRGIKTPTPLYWSKHISTDLRDSRGWSIWFEKTGIPEKNGKITSLPAQQLPCCYTSSTQPATLRGSAKLTKSPKNLDRAHPPTPHPNLFFGNLSLTWTEHSNHNNQQLLTMYTQTEYTLYTTPKYQYWFRAILG